MQEDLFRCAFCCEFYNLELYIPKVLVCCPHCLCLKCLQNLFITHFPQELRCPICNVSFPSRVGALEDLETDLTLLHLLPSQPNGNVDDGAKFADERDLMNEGEDFFRYKILKKQKIKQEINESVELEESTEKQFTGMRKRRHAKQPETFQNSDNDNQFAQIINQLQELAEITNKLQGEFAETGEADKVMESSDEMEEEFDIEEVNNQIMEIESGPELKLDFSNKDISDEIFYGNFFNKTEKDKVYHIELNSHSSSLTDQQFIKFVQIILAQMENLTSIALNLANTNISSQSLQVLSYQCLKNCKLKSFKLNCSHTSVQYEGLKNLDDGLNSSVSTLENLEIVLDSTWILGEKFLDVLSRFTKLKLLKLSFENSQFSAEIVPSIIFCVSFLAKNLESFELNFNGTEIDDENLESFVSQAISPMTKLRHLKLFLGETFISNEFLFGFFQSLSSIANHLETLELDLHWTELSNAAFKHFCQEILSKMQNIENLKLDLSKTKITGTSLKSLVLPVHKLNSLALNLSENKINDSGLQRFKENNNLRNIKSIDFQIHQTNVSDEALQDFLNYVEKGESTKASPSSNEASSEELKSKNESLSQEESEQEGKVYAKLMKELVLQFEKKIRKKQNKISLEANQKRRKMERKQQDNQDFIKDDPPRDQLLSEIVLSIQWFKKYGREISFRKNVMDILKSIEIRTFSVFYQKLLAFIRELSKTYTSWKMSRLKNETSSMNWWYRYMRRDEELTNLWKNLPSPHE